MLKLKAVGLVAPTSLDKAITTFARALARFMLIFDNKSRQN